MTIYCGIMKLVINIFTLSAVIIHITYIKHTLMCSIDVCVSNVLMRATGILLQDKIIELLYSSNKICRAITEYCFNNEEKKRVKIFTVVA